MTDVAEQTMVVMVRVAAEVFNQLPGLSKILSPVGKLLGMGGSAVKDAVLPQASINSIKSAGVDLDVVDVPAGEYRALKADMKHYGVDFAVSKDKSTGNVSLLFKAKDTRLVEKAMTKIVAKYGSEEDISIAGQEQNINDVEQDQATNRTAPATDKQVEFIDALHERGTISADEIKAFNDDPNVLKANELLNNHKDHAGYIEFDRSKEPRTLNEKISTAKQKQATKAAVKAKEKTRGVSKAKQVGLEK